MDLNRIAGLGCCSWYFNKKSKKSEKSRETRELSQPSRSDENTKKDLKIRRKRYGVCLKCGQPLTDIKYCQSCSSSNFQSKFNDWTSENQHIDDFIQHSQLTATNEQTYLLWIPFDDLIQVKYLANGGHTSVYSAIWDHFETSQMIGVVLKRLHNGQISNPVFLKEQVSIFLYGGASDSNIVRCYGFTKHPTEGYMLVLEYAEDGDIRNFLRGQSSTLLWLDKLLILRDTSKSLDLLHNHEFIHGDLHTGNILKKHQRENSNLASRVLKNKKKKSIYNPRSRETIIDIPLSFDSDISDTVTSVSPYGVIPYVAPEVFEKGYYTKQSDIYSFGIVMWEISSNQSPFFEYSNDKALVSDILNGARPEIEDQPIPKCVISLIQRCWDPEPFNRPSAKTITSMINEWIWILSSSKIRLSSKSKDILEQFSSSNNTTIKKVKRQSKLPPSLSRAPTLLRNNNYYSKSLSKYLTTVDVEKSANASSFASSSFSSTDSANSAYQRQQDQQDQHDYYL